MPPGAILLSLRGLSEEFTVGAGCGQVSWRYGAALAYPVLISSCGIGIRQMVPRARPATYPVRDVPDEEMALVERFVIDTVLTPRVVSLLCMRGLPGSLSGTLALR